MSSLFFFIALVGVALLSGLGKRSDAARGIGAEFVVGGIIVGPALLGLVQRSTLAGFLPLILMGISWLTAATGMHHGLYRAKFVGFSAYGAGALLGSVFLLGIGLAVRHLGWASRELAGLNSQDLWIFACMAGSALGVNVEYRGEAGETGATARGKLRAGMSSGGTLAVLVALGLVVAIDPPKLQVPWPSWGWGLFGPFLGGVFGMTVAALLGRKFRFGEFWPVAIGAVLLVAGLAARFQASLVATSFALGVCLVTLSPHREVIRELAARAAVPIQLPLAVLAGALVTWPTSGSIWLLVGELVLVRIAIQYASGVVVARLARAGGGHEFGLSLLPVGHVGLAIAMLAQFRVPDPLGKVILLSACLSAILGQLLGAPALQRLSHGSVKSEPQPTPTERGLEEEHA